MTPLDKQAEDCILKERFSYPEHAQEDIDRAWYQSRLLLDVYFCKICKGYHLTRLS